MLEVRAALPRLTFSTRQPHAAEEEANGRKKKKRPADLLRVVRGDVSLLCWNFSRTFSRFSHHSRKLKVGRLQPCPGVRLCGGVSGCSNCLGSHISPAPFTTLPTLGLNFEAMQGEEAEEHWPEPQRSGATPTSISAALTSPLRQRGGQGRLEEDVQGRGREGGSWHATFRVWSKVHTGNHAPGRERSLCSRDFCLMLFLFLPLICLLQPGIRLQSTSLFLLQVRVYSLPKSAREERVKAIGTCRSNLQ